MHGRKNQEKLKKCFLKCYLLLKAVLQDFSKREMSNNPILSLSHYLTGWSKYALWAKKDRERSISRLPPWKTNLRLNLNLNESVKRVLRWGKRVEYRHGFLVGQSARRFGLNTQSGRVSKERRLASVLSWPSAQKRMNFNRLNTHWQMV